MNDDQAESDAIMRALKVGRHEKAGYQCPQCATPYWIARKCPKCGVAAVTR